MYWQAFAKLHAILVLVETVANIWSGVDMEVVEGAAIPTIPRGKAYQDPRVMEQEILTKA